VLAAPAELARLAASDIYWDRVVAIEASGPKATYDLQIEDDHNFRQTTSWCTIRTP
jgi:intein/homing endonuclease